MYVMTNTRQLLYLHSSFKLIFNVGLEGLIRELNIQTSKNKLIINEIQPRFDSHTLIIIISDLKLDNRLVVNSLLF